MRSRVGSPSNSSRVYFEGALRSYLSSDEKRKHKTDSKRLGEIGKLDSESSKPPFNLIPAKAQKADDCPVFLPPMTKLGKLCLRKMPFIQKITKTPVSNYNPDIKNEYFISSL